MTQLFDADESAYTATALKLVPNQIDDDSLNFNIWGNPERDKINAALVAANRYLHKRRGVY